MPKKGKPIFDGWRKGVAFESGIIILAGILVACLVIYVGLYPKV